MKSLSFSCVRHREVRHVDHAARAAAAAAATKREKTVSTTYIYSKFSDILATLGIWATIIILQNNKWNKGISATIDQSIVTFYTKFGPPRKSS